MRRTAVTSVGRTIHVNDRTELDALRACDVGMVHLQLRVRAGKGQDRRLGSQVVGVDLDCGFTAVAAGGEHSLGLKAGGSIVAWGKNDNGQTVICFNQCETTCFLE